MRKRVLGVIITIIIIAGATVGTIFGIQAATKTGIFKVPGRILIDITDESEADFLSDILLDSDGKPVLELEQDVTITSSRDFTRPSGEQQLLYEIYLPVADFYSVETSVTQSEVTNGKPGVNLIPFSKLDNKVKLLAVDDHYYLDEFDSGALFVYFTLSGENPTDLASVKALVSAKLQSFPGKNEILTFAQTGVTALSRRMNGKVASTGPEFFSAKIGDFLSSFDLTHTSNESSFYQNASSEGVTGTPICSKPAFINTLLGIGLDIVELTGNHNRDCGYTAALSTIDAYEQNGIKRVGGGKNATDATTPLLIDQKGTGITMLAYNLSTGGYTTGSNPGANLYSEADAIKNIAAAKERGDFVLIDIQYFECNNYANTYWDSSCSRANSVGSQQSFFRHLIDLGADMVVGTAAHQAQTYELYGDGVIYYGLGNLFFDQYKWEGTRLSLVLGHYFYDGRLLQTRLSGTEYGNDFQPHLMDKERLAWFISQLVALH